MTSPITQATDYFPLGSGCYEVRPGLYRFDIDFGNGDADSKIFQIDSEFSRYRAAKLATRRERLSKYYCLHRYAPPVARTIADFIARRLAREYPSWFTLIRNDADWITLSCALTRERLVFDRRMALTETRSENQCVPPPYTSALDARCSQIQEDVAVVSRSAGNWLSAILPVLPNH